MGEMRDGMRLATEDGGKVHGARVVDDDVGAGAKGVDERVIDETAYFGLGDAVWERVGGSRDDLDLMGFGEKFSEFGDVRVLFGAPLGPDVNGDEGFGWGGKLLLVEAFDELPGNGCDRGPRAIAIANGKPTSRKGKIEKRGTARGEGEPSAGAGWLRWERAFLRRCSRGCLREW